VIRIMQVAKLPCDTHVVFKAPTERRDLPAVRARDVDDLLDTGDQRGKGRDDDAARRDRENLLVRLADDALGWRSSLALHIHAIGDQEPDAPVPKLTEQIDVGRAIVDRRRVELEVTGDDHQPGGRRDAEANGVRNTVRDAERLDREITRDQARMLVRVEHLQLYAIGQPAL